MAGIPLDRSRPLWEMCRDRGSGERADRRLHQDAPRHRGRGLGCQHDLGTVQPRAGRTTAGPAGPARRPVVEHVPGDLELFARGVVSTVARPCARVRADPADDVAGRAHGRASPGRHGDGGARSPLRGRPSTAPSPGSRVGGVRRISPWTGSRRSRTPWRVPRSTTSCWRSAVGPCVRYLADRDELPGELVAGQRAGVGARPSRGLAGGTNKVSTMFARLGTDVADPVERLQRARPQQRPRQGAPRRHPGRRAAGVGPVRRPADLRPGGADGERAEARREGPGDPQPGDLERPGPPVPLYFLGARIDGLYPLGPIFHGAGLNITVMSSDGRMHVGLIACRDAVPDVDQPGGGLSARAGPLLRRNRGEAPRRGGTVRDGRSLGERQRPDSAEAAVEEDVAGVGVQGVPERAWAAQGSGSSPCRQDAPKLIQTGTHCAASVPVAAMPHQEIAPGLERRPRAVERRSVRC